MIASEKIRMCCMLLLFGCGRIGFQPTADAGPHADSTFDDTGPPADSPFDDTAVDLCLRNETACLTAGGNCVSGGCTIVQTTSPGVVCPDGMPCTVSCELGGCQGGGVDCAGATTCDVTCTGGSACQGNGVDCGSASVCNVLCSGINACQLGPAGADRSVECRGSICSVTCKGGSNVCQAGIDPGTGTCVSHCCDGACGGGSCPNNDNVCL